MLSLYEFNIYKMKRIFGTLIIVLCGLVSQAQSKVSENIPDKIFEAIELGDVERLSKYFTESIELIILDDEGIYSIQQANQILKAFFSKNRPESFKVLHQGGSKNSKYAIGNLKTKDNNYRVHFLVKISDGKLYIHQLRIQEEGNDEE